MYKHTQIGYLTLGTLVAAALVISATALTAGSQSVGVWGLAVLAVVGVLFSTLTVEVRGGELIWYFGPGVPRKRVRIADIEHVEAVRNSWWYGWGIRRTPHGWLYNVSGLNAVEVTTRDGKRFRLGTDEPQALLRALETHMLR